MTNKDYSDTIEFLKENLKVELSYDIVGWMESYHRITVMVTLEGSVVSESHIDIPKKGIMEW